MATSQTKMLFYLPPDLKAALQERAATENRPLASLIRDAIVKYLDCDPSLAYVQEAKRVYSAANTAVPSKITRDKNSEARKVLNYLAAEYPGLIEAIINDEEAS